MQPHFSSCMNNLVRRIKFQQMCLYHIFIIYVASYGYAIILHRQYRPQISVRKSAPNHQLDRLIVLKKLRDKLYLEH